MSGQCLRPLFTVPPRFLCPAIPRQFVRTIRSVQPKIKHSRFNNGHKLPVLTASKKGAFLRKEPMLPLRTGALAIKTGMTGMYDPETAERIPCTVLQLERCQVVSHKRMDRHGYWAVQVGCGSKKVSNFTRAELGHFEACGVPRKRHLAEFRVQNGAGLPEIGSVITAGIFKEGQFVDARATTKGKGFAGGMKRWGWAGQPASHGNSLSHRVMGSAGGSQGSGSRVHPGKHMPGRMGGERHTVQNLKVMKIDTENGIIVVQGAVPGPNRGIVQLQDAIKKPWPDMDPEYGLTMLGTGVRPPPVEATTES